MALTKDEKIALDQKAIQSVHSFRKIWGIPEKPIEDIYSLVKSKEFLLLRFPNEYKISGVYLEKKDRDDNFYRCIYVNNKEPLGRQNFTIAHELYHAFFEKSKAGICLQSLRSKDSVEYTAERFASNLLIPRNYLAKLLMSKQYINNNSISTEKMFELQKRFNVSFQAMVYTIMELDNEESTRDLVPRNIGSYKKYFSPNYWEQLIRLSISYGCLELNMSNPCYEFLTEFKTNIVNNVKRNKMNIEDAQEIFDFFDQKLEL